MATTKKKKTVAKAATKEKEIKKTAVKKKSVSTKKIAPKKAAKKPAKSAKTDTSMMDITPKERWKMVAVAAYHKAEKRGFAPGHDLQDWIDAEKEIAALLRG
jgi:hypothetical protein